MYKLALLFVAFSIFGSSTLHAQGRGRIPATPENVRSAMEQIVEYLKQSQDRQAKGKLSGSWPGYPHEGTGLTSLVVLALLSSGLPPSDSCVAKALEYIRSVSPNHVYEASLQIMSLCAAGQARDRERIQRSLEWLIKAQQSSGGWAYESGAGLADESNSQFAVLALWEASRAGFQVPEDVLTKSRAYWTNTQKGSAWGYRGDAARASMTCAGIASMTILDDVASSPDAAIKGETILCCGAGNHTSEFDPSLSLEWLGSHFSVNENFGSPQWFIYYLYALERVGRLTGQRFIGQHDWYREGSEAIINRILPGGAVRGGPNEDQYSASAMALLFLSKGKRQIVLGHLQYGNGGNDWNHHRRAVQNMTSHVESVWKRDLAWQTVKLQRSTLSDLLESPVLFISGSGEFKLAPEHRKLLQEYVRQGGFIFAEACNGNGCNGKAFDESFRKEMELVFDKPLQKLPPTHPIWTAESRIAPDSLPEGFWLYGLEDCCRTSVVYSPTSLSCRWELSKPYGVKPKLSPKVSGDLENAVKIGLNVVAYATGRELKEKLADINIIQTDANRQVLERGFFVLPKIMHSGGGNETPNALAHLQEIFRKETNSHVDNKTPLLSASSPELEKYPIVYFHGRNSFVFSEDELKGIRRHFETGGFVLGDAICGSPEFAESVRTEFAKVFKDAKWIDIPPNHPILDKDGIASGSFDLHDVTLIDPAAATTTLQSAKRNGPVELRALEWNGRLIMLFSPNDLSCALESKHSMQCRGYSRLDAFRIGFNMILYALSN